MFVDSVYLIALHSTKDNWHRVSEQAARDIPPRQPLVTTWGVFAETLAHFSRASRTGRIQIVRRLRALEFQPNYTVIPESVELLSSASDLYAGEFAHSTFSLQDCVAIQIMREYEIESILTADQECSRAGFTPLLRGYID